MKFEPNNPDMENYDMGGFHNSKIIPGRPGQNIIVPI
jgi:hypothetical protein